MGGCCSQEREGKDEEDGARRKKPQRAFTRDTVCCTDIPFLIIFLGFVALMVYIAVFCVMNGDARRIVFGYDSFGNTCNQDNTNNRIPNVTDSGKNLMGMGNVFFMNIFDPFNSMQICVSKCPETDMTEPEDVWRFAEETGSKLCHYDLPLSQYKNINNYKLGGQGPCPRLPIFKSVSLLQRCAPDPYALLNNDDDDGKTAKSSMDDDRKNVTERFLGVYEFDDIFRRVLSDLYSSWREMIVLCVLSIVVSFIVVIMIRYLAPIIVWVIVVAAGVGTLVGTGFLWFTYARIVLNLNEMEEFFSVPLLGISVSNEKAFLGLSITATVITVILLLILLVLRKRIGLAIALFKEAGKCVIDLPSLLVQPIWTFIILLAFLGYWLAIMAFIGTSGVPVPRYDLDFQSVRFVQQGFASHFWWIHLVGLIWVSEVILASQQFVISGAVAMWFFTRNKKKMGCPCASAISSLILHHLGSIAFGSFIIVLVKIPRYILMYISSRIEGKASACAKCCAKCCICCLWCLEKLLKFLNKNAYTIIAMKGVGFCTAAKKALEILTSNALRVIAINGVGGFVLFLAKIGITATTCAIGVVWLRENNDLHFYAIPVFFAGLFAFLCAHCALTVYDMVVDALLLCFCEDGLIKEKNPEYELFMSNSLKDYVDSASKELDSGTASGDDVRSGAEDKEMTPLSAEPTAV